MPDHSTPDRVTIRVDDDTLLDELSYQDGVILRQMDQIESLIATVSRMQQAERRRNQIALTALAVSLALAVIGGLFGK